MRHEEKPTASKGRGARTAGVLLGLCAVVFGLVFWYLSGLLAEQPKPVKQVVQVQVFRPPPPPPPPEVEPQEVVEVEEPIEMPEPEPLPDLPDQPSAELLGLDAEGVAGNDAFGLLANRGGTGLVGSEGRYRWYAQRLKDQVNDALSAENLTQEKRYRVRVLIWVDPSGTLSRIRLATTSGDPDLDAALQKSLAAIERFADAPPVGLPQPISLRIENNV